MIEAIRDRGDRALNTRNYLSAAAALTYLFHKLGECEDQSR
jgi:hypothetical protein